MMGIDNIKIEKISESKIVNIDFKNRIKSIKLLTDYIFQEFKKV